MKKYFIAILVSLVFAPFGLSAQEDPFHIRGGRLSGYQLIAGDTVITVSVAPVYVFTKPKDMRQYERLVRNVKKVYPYAKEAREYLERMDADLAQMTSQKEKDKYTKALEKEILKKYTPVLEQMTYSQGKVLIKLIDRETQRTSYDILREFRGRFSAGFWSGIAKLFKFNLKDGYNKDGDDKLIEQIIIMYEAGLL